jgi:two-component system, NarL family, response regulator DevR
LFNTDSKRPAEAITAPTDATIALLLVDDHEIVRIGLRRLFELADGIDVVAEAATASEAVHEAARTKPDVVLMDVRLRDGSGVDACREILAQSPATRVLFLTSYDDEEAMLSAVFAGAHGYLLKEIGSESLLRAIRCVAAGQSILDPAATRAMIDKMQSLLASGTAGGADSLSSQEYRVLALVAQGKTNKEIATALDLSDKTVKNYLSNIFQKLRVTRRSQAAAIFSKHSR